MKKLSIVVVILLISSYVFASFSYDALEQEMLKSNTRLKSAREAIVQASLDTKDAKASYYPTADLTISASYLQNPIGPISINASELSLPYNGYITLYKGQESAYYQAQLSLVQPIFTWNKITNGIKAYKELESVKQYEMINLENQLISELKITLSTLFYIKDMVNILSEQKELSDKLISQMTSAYEQGIILLTDLNEAKIDALQLDMTIAEIQGQYSKLLTNLRVLTGVYDLKLEDIEFNIDESYFYTLSKQDRQELVQKATSQSQVSLKLLSHMQNALSYSKEIKDASLYWKPDFAIQVSASYAGSRLPLVETDWYRKDDYNLTLTIALTTTILDGGKRFNDVKRANSELDTILITRDEAVNTILTTLVEQFSKLDLSVSKLSFLDLKEETLIDKLKQEEALYKVGSVSEAKVIEAQININNNKLERVQEKINLSQGAYIIEYLTSN